MLRLSLVLAVALVIAACSSTPTPTPVLPPTRAPTATPAPTSTPIPTPNRPTLLENLSQFEISEFCRTYRCRLSDQWALNRGGTNNSYDTSSLGDVSVEVVTDDGKPSEFGLVFWDRAQLSQSDIAAISLFLGAAHPGVPIDPSLQEFLKTNAELDKFQICQGRSIEFGLLKVWAAKVGSGPTIHIGESCPE